MKKGGLMVITDKTQKTIVPDEQIVELYWKRDEKAIQFTDDKYGQFLYRVAYNILHDRSDCEECQNDTYNMIRFIQNWNWRAHPLWSHTKAMRTETQISGLRCK